MKVISLDHLLRHLRDQATAEATKDMSVDEIFEVVDALNREIMRRLNVLEYERRKIKEELEAQQNTQRSTD